MVACYEWPCLAKLGEVGMRPTRQTTIRAALRAGAPVSGRGRPRREDYLTPTQAAAVAASAGYPISSKTLARAFDAGDLPGYRTPGGYRRIRRTALEEYLRRVLDTTDRIA